MWGKYPLLLALSSLMLSNSQEEANTSSCSPNITIQKNTQYKASAGQSLTLRCPISFCFNQLPNVTWCKLDREKCEPMKQKLGISFDWTEKKTIDGVYLLKFQSLEVKDNGSYLCITDNTVSHAIEVIIFEYYNQKEDSFEVSNRSKTWITYFIVSIRFIVMIVVSGGLFFYFRKIKVTSHKHPKVKSIAGKVRFLTGQRTVNTRPAGTQPGSSSNRPPDTDPPTESIEII